MSYKHCRGLNLNTLIERTNSLSSNNSNENLSNDDLKNDIFSIIDEANKQSLISLRYHYAIENFSKTCKIKQKKDQEEIYNCVYNEIQHMGIHIDQNRTLWAKVKSMIYENPNFNFKLSVKGMFYCIYTVYDISNNVSKNIQVVYRNL